MIDVILLHQFVVQIAITKNLNVDSRLVSKSASTYFTNRVFSFAMLDPNWVELFYV